MQELPLARIKKIMKLDEDVKVRAAVLNQHNQSKLMAVHFLSLIVEKGATQQLSAVHLVASCVINWWSLLWQPSLLRLLRVIFNIFLSLPISIEVMYVLHHLFCRHQSNHDLRISIMHLKESYSLAKIRQKIL